MGKSQESSNGAHIIDYVHEVAESQQNQSQGDHHLLPCDRDPVTETFSAVTQRRPREELLWFGSRRNPTWSLWAEVVICMSGPESHPHLTGGGEDPRCE